MDESDVSRAREQAKRKEKQSLRRGSRNKAGALPVLLQNMYRLSFSLALAFLSMSLLLEPRSLNEDAQL